MSLHDDLTRPIISLSDFKKITIRILHYLPEIKSSETIVRGYVILKSTSGSIEKFARPYKEDLFLKDPGLFQEKWEQFINILERKSNKESSFSSKDHLTINQVPYTIQQSIGIALDFLGNQNANRKHVGNRFEELIRLIINEIKINHKKIILKIPYSEEGKYSCETDVVLSPFDQVQSTNQTIHEDEIIISLKTSSKDRMAKIFIDKLLVSKFVDHPVKVVGIFLNDVQRSKKDKISFTLVAGLFMVYTKFLIELDGVYFIDPPPTANKPPYSDHIKPFSVFLLSEIDHLLTIS